MENHLVGTKYGDSNREYNVWKIIWRVQCMGTRVNGTTFGDSYLG